MHFFHPRGLSRFALSAAVLGLLLTLLLTPGEVQGQMTVTISGKTSVSVAEDTATTEILETYTATGSGTKTWTLEGTDSEDFAISTDGKLTLAAAPDFESPDDSDTDNEYSITVKVTVGSDSDTHDVTITVTDVNEPPTLDKTTTAYDYAENGTDAVVTIDATDPDSGHDLTWTLTGDDAGDFNIAKDANQDGVLTFKSSPDFENPADTFEMPDTEGDNVYKVTVSVRDSLDDSGTEDTTEVDDSISLVITVTDANDAHTFSSETATRSVDENTATNTNIGAVFTATDEDDDDLIYGMEASGDPSDFAFDASTRQIKTKSALDHEAKDSYTVTITVHDGYDADGMSDTSVDDTIEVTITVNDLNEAPTIDSGSAAFSVNENTPDSMIIQDYDASDVDVPSQSLTWSIEGTDVGDFRIKLIQRQAAICPEQFSQL